MSHRCLTSAIAEATLPVAHVGVRSPGAVYVGAMVDEANPDNVIIFTDLVNDSICADPRRVEPGQFSQERFPDSMRDLEKGTPNEVKNSNPDLLW